MHFALFTTATLCVRSSHVRSYSVCGHLKYGIARYSSALCLKCGIIQYTCTAFYDLAAQCVRSLYVKHYTIWQRSVSGYHTYGFMQYGNTVWLHRSTVCKVITCTVLFGVWSPQVWHCTIQQRTVFKVGHYTIHMCSILRFNNTLCKVTLCKALYNMAAQCVRLPHVWLYTIRQTLFGYTEAQCVRSSHVWH